MPEPVLSEIPTPNGPGAEGHERQLRAPALCLLLNGQSERACVIKELSLRATVAVLDNQMLLLGRSHGLRLAMLKFIKLARQRHRGRVPFHLYALLVSVQGRSAL